MIQPTHRPTPRTNSLNCHCEAIYRRGNLTKGNNTYTYGNSNWGDLLTAYNGTIINYDEIGNPNNWRDGMSFDWQNGRQLASVTKDGKTYSFTYDSSGLRTSKKNDNGTPEDETDDIVTTFTYVDGKLVHQTDGTNVWYFYYDATGKLISMEYNGEQYYYVYDSIGNIVVLMTYDVLDKANYSYDAWGKIVDISGDLRNVNPMRYKGYYYDQELGLYYLQSRYYDPEIGRFINADSFMSTGQGMTGHNMFVYCGNCPTSRIDVEGYLWDTILDVGFILLDVYFLIANEGWKEAENWCALGLDILFAAIPFASGGGQIVKTADAISDFSKVTVIGETMSRVSDAASTVNAIDNLYSGFKAYDTLSDSGKVGKIAAEALGKTSNAIWLYGKLRSGYTVLDIGIDITRSARSSSYILEKIITTTWQYRNYIKISTRIKQVETLRLMEAKEKNNVSSCCR